jgi:hypothetical protein
MGAVKSSGSRAPEPPPLRAFGVGKTWTAYTIHQMSWKGNSPTVSFAKLTVVV